MGAVKSIISGVLAAAGLAAIAWGVLQAPGAQAAAERGPLRAVELRAFPGVPAAKATATPLPEEEPEPLRPLIPADAGTSGPRAADAGAARVEAPADGGSPAAPKAGPSAPGPAAPGPAAPAAARDGSLSLSASDTADIYLDGKKVGSSPMRGLKVRAGPHKVRFDCYDAAGNAVTGTVKVVAVVADQELAITYPCPESQ